MPPLFVIDRASSPGLRPVSSFGEQRELGLDESQQLMKSPLAGASHCRGVTISTGVAPGVSRIAATHSYWPDP